MADKKVKLEEVCQQVFGISSRRYRQLAKAGLVPEPEGGYIDFILATKKLIEYYQKLIKGQGSLTLTEERARLVQIQASLAELEYEKALGNLLEKEEVIRVWTGMILSARARLLSIPSKVAPLLDGKNKAERKEILERYVYEALNELAKMQFDEIEKKQKESEKKKEKVKSKKGNSEQKKKEKRNKTKKRKKKK